MKPPPITSLFYEFMEHLERDLLAGVPPGEAFARARAAQGEECPFVSCEITTSCMTCKHFDRGHCHRWGKTVPAQFMDAGCAEHAAVGPTSYDPTIPF